MKLGKYKLILLITIILLNREKLFATAQYPDLLIDGKDTIAIFSNPLEQYLDKKQKRTLCGEELKWTSTACYRGYQATWIIQNDSLFLLNIKLGCEDEGKRYFDLKKEFHTDKKVFAKWFTGKIMCPIGELLQYVHAGYGSIYEKEKIIFIKNGMVDSIENKNYLVFDKNLLNPSRRILKDTLYEIIISNIDLTLLKNISDRDVCEISIQFNSNGIIDSIYYDHKQNYISFMEKYLLFIAKKTLMKLPPLMKVNHQRYVSPTIHLFFTSHCLKYPWDTLYGCYKIKKNTHSPLLVDRFKVSSVSCIIWLSIILGVVFITLLILSKKYKRKSFK